jgi:glucose/arabinose dehydrogenase
MKHLALIVAISLPSMLQANLAVKKIADGFNRPVWAGDPGTSPNTLWLMEQHGVVHQLDTTSGKKTTLFDLSERVSRKGNEEGMLGLAFAPDFAKSGRFYINYTDRERFTCISRLQLTAAGISEEKEEIILRYKQDFENHNGGWLGFGPDKMLYIGNGDGGSGNDPKQRAQDLDTLLGKILRIDVSPEKGYTVPKDNPFLEKKGARPEIWAYGLRNPWRCAFDIKTDEFWIADVGQNHAEEVNVIDRKASAGANFGWRMREGNISTPAKNVGGEASPNYIEPIYSYKHGSGKDQGLSVTGGFLYRGKAIPELQGRYIFADYVNPRIWSLHRKEGKEVEFLDHTDDLQSAKTKFKRICSFAEDRAGELYIIDHVGPLYKIVSES